MCSLFALLSVAISQMTPPLGALSEAEEVLAWQKRAASEPATPIPQTRFSVAASPTVEHCRFHRLGPEAPDSRDLKLRFVRLPEGARRDGFPVDAQVAQGYFAEFSKLPLWYDARGRLVATLTLPPPPAGTKERPGTREEFVVFRYLPATAELLGEWQRAVGPSPPAASALSGLPHAILVEKELVYSSYLRASAYMLCRAAPREALPDEGGSARPSDDAGTRHPGP